MSVFKKIRSLLDLEWEQWQFSTPRLKENVSDDYKIVEGYQASHHSGAELYLVYVQGNNYPYSNHRLSYIMYDGIKMPLSWWSSRRIKKDILKCISRQFELKIIDEGQKCPHCGMNLYGA